MRKHLSKHQTRGFALLGVAVALAFLGAMGAGLTALVASNNYTQIAQQYLNQNFYISHAAMEWALRNVRVNGLQSIPSRQFLGSAISATVNAKLNVTTTYGMSGYLATNTESITNPGTGGPSCVYVLAASGSGMVGISGTANLSASTCTMNVNSSSATAVTASGSSSTNLYYLKIVGSYSKSGTATITTHSGSVTTGVTAVADPLLAYNIPVYAACAYTNTSISGSTVTTLTPGVYCGGITIAGTANVTFSAGNYILDGGTLSISGSPTVNGTGVTFFLNKQLKTTYPTISFSGSATTAFSAPTSGTYAGILIFQSRSAASAANTISGSAALSLTGAIYLPNQTLTLSGSASSSAPCTMLVVNKLTISGSPNFSCSSGSLNGLVY